MQKSHFWAVDTSGKTVWSERPEALGSCQFTEASPAFVRLYLSSGTTRTFTAQWQTTSRLQPGAYLLEGRFFLTDPEISTPEVTINIVR